MNIRIWFHKDVLILGVFVLLALLPTVGQSQSFSESALQAASAMEIGESGSGSDSNPFVWQPPLTDSTASSMAGPLAESSPFWPEVPLWHRQTYAIGPGDTLLGMLLEASVPRLEADNVLEALSNRLDLRRLRVGQQVDLVFAQSGESEPRLAFMAIAPDPVRTITLTRQGDSQFVAGESTKAVFAVSRATTGIIRNSLYADGLEAGIPVSVLLTMIRVYSHDVDFQRDFQPGDQFAVLYEQILTHDGQPVRDGVLLSANLILSGKEKPIYRFTNALGKTDYYDRSGASQKRALLRTPIDGARLTSSFGMRRHPLLGYSKMHKGADFGAPSGTPVYAAGNGAIVEAGRKGAYGNYIRLRHGGDIATAYAHLSRFAPRSRPGLTVMQGDVIGFVGSTGRSTGPHLHYEVLRSGKPVNPLSVVFPAGENLQGPDLQAFHVVAQERDATFTLLLAEQHNQSGAAFTPVAIPCAAGDMC